MRSKNIYFNIVSDIHYKASIMKDVKRLSKKQLLELVNSKCPNPSEADDWAYKVFLAKNYLSFEDKHHWNH
uniref:Uncharacterized protein n=1 Tax=viral metagenome TaxID=1070528 RepID=A0A6M3L6A3_9ZZZZ